MTLFYIFCLEYSFASNTYWSLHWINDSYSKRYENVGDKFARLFFWRELFNIGIHFAFFENATIWSWGPTLNRIQQLAKGANMNVNELLYTRTFLLFILISYFVFVQFLSTKLHIYLSSLVHWVDHSKTLREQGIAEVDVLLLKRKYFYNDANIDSRDPIQLNLLYQVKYYLINKIN